MGSGCTDLEKSSVIWTRYPLRSLASCWDPAAQVRDSKSCAPSGDAALKSLRCWGEEQMAAAIDRLEPRLREILITELFPGMNFGV